MIKLNNKKRLDKQLYQQAKELAQRPYSNAIVHSGYEYYVATVFVLHGCKTDGKTITEAQQNMEIAKADYIYALLSEGLPVPEPDTLGCFVIMDCDG